MQISKENLGIQRKIAEFEKRIEEMHQDFYKYYNGLEQRMPDWEGFERELVNYSRKKIYDPILSNNFDRILYKFQNRKKIWLTWAEELHHLSKKGISIRKRPGNESTQKKIP